MTPASDIWKLEHLIYEKLYYRSYKACKYYPEKYRTYLYITWMASAMIHASEHAYWIFVMPYNGSCFVWDKGMLMGRYGEETYTQYIKKCFSNGTECC